MLFMYTNMIIELQINRMRNGEGYYWSLEKVSVTKKFSRFHLVNEQNVVSFGRSSENMVVLEGPLIFRNHFQFLRSRDLNDWRSV